MSDNFYKGWASVVERSRQIEQNKKKVKLEEEKAKKMEKMGLVEGQKKEQWRVGATKEQEDSKGFLRKTVEATKKADFGLVQQVDSKPTKKEIQKETGFAHVYDRRKFKKENSEASVMVKNAVKSEEKARSLFDPRKVKNEGLKLAKEIKTEEIKTSDVEGVKTEEENFGGDIQSESESEDMEWQTQPTKEQKDTKDFMRNPVVGLVPQVDAKPTKKEIQKVMGFEYVYDRRKVKKEKSESSVMVSGLQKQQVSRVKTVNGSPEKGESWARFLQRNGRALGSLSVEERERISSEWDDTCGGYFNIRDFAIGRPIGKGKTGRVYVAKDLVNQQHLVALKVFFKSSLARSESEQILMREIEVQSKLHHPHVLRLYNYFWDETKIYLIVEFAVQGDLFIYMNKKHPLDHATVAKFISQLAKGLKYLHGNDIIHRDIKPENLLLDANGDLKIADFGWSVCNEKDNKRKSMCGTVAYMAPEILKGYAYDHSVDLWAVGVLLFELLTGKEPFAANEVQNVYKRITAANFYLPETIPTSAKHLVTNLLKIDPEERLSVEEILQHPWIQYHAKKREEEEGCWV